MQNKVIFTNENNKNSIESTFNELLNGGEYSSPNEYVISLQELGQLKFINYSELLENDSRILNALEGCEVLIVEDDIKIIIKYFQILENAKEVKTIYACTKKNLTQAVFKALIRNEQIVKTRLIILDFDLDETTNQDEKQYNTQELYELLADEQELITDGNYRIFAITAYEGNTEKFANIQKYMRQEGQFDLVLNKGLFLDNKKYLENLFRNIIGLYVPIEKQTKIQKKAPKPTAEQKQVEPQTKPPLTPQQERLLNSSAKTLLDNLEAAMPEIAQKKKFSVSNDYVEVKGVKGKSYSSYQTLTEAIEDNHLNIVELLNSFPDRWKKLKYQIREFGVFKKQLRQK